MKTLKLFSLKAIGGFEGKIIKYHNERVRDINDHWVTGSLAY